VQQLRNFVLNVPPMKIDEVDKLDTDMIATVREEMKKRVEEMEAINAEQRDQLVQLLKSIEETRAQAEEARKQTAVELEALQKQNEELERQMRQHTITSQTSISGHTSGSNARCPEEIKRVLQQSGASKVATYKSQQKGRTGIHERCWKCPKAWASVQQCSTCGIDWDLQSAAKKKKEEKNKKAQSTSQMGGIRERCYKCPWKGVGVQQCSRCGIDWD
jgi:hypothetical protein